MKKTDAKISVKNNTFNSVQIQIETERLLIFSYHLDCFENSLSLYSNPTITKFFDHGQPKNLDEVYELVYSMGVSRFQKGEVLGLFSIFRKNDGAFLGHIDLMPSDANTAVEVGYILSDQFHGSGYGTEALRAMLFDYLPELIRKNQLNGVQKIIATVHPHNHPSKKLLEKVGMKYEKEQSRFNQPRLWYYLDLDA